MKKRIASDLFYSFIAIGIMNVVLQLIVYPCVNSWTGETVFGNLLFYQGLIAILAPSFGSSVHNTRLVIPNRDETKNGDYMFILSLFSVIAGVVTLAVCLYQAEQLAFIIGLLIVMGLSVLRNYANVEYRLTLNYRQQFVFFALLSAGYLVGVGLFYFNHIWLSIFVCGELCAVLWVVWKGQVFRHPFACSVYRGKVAKTACALAGSYLLMNGMLNLDRVVLKYLIGAEAVTEYYVLSLLGKMAALIGNPLNGVIIGYLTKRSIRLERKNYCAVGLLLLGFGLLFWALCVAGTPVYIGLMYPTLNVSMGLSPAVNAAQILYFLTNTLLMIVLTFVHVRWQLIIQVSYTLLFLSSSVALTYLFGLRGFVMAAVISSVAYFILTFIVGFIESGRKRDMGGEPTA